MEDITSNFPMLSAEEEIVVPELIQDTPNQVYGGTVNAPFNVVVDYWQVKVGSYNYERSGIDTMTYAATIALDTSLADLHKTTTVHATGNATINGSSGGIAGQRLHVLVANDATSGKTITFGTNFLASATLVGTASKSAVVSFISDGTAFYEVSRATVL